MCSLPLLAPVVWTSSIGGGSSYGPATSPPLARNSPIPSVFQRRSLARNAAAASSRSGGERCCDIAPRLFQSLRRFHLSFLRHGASSSDIANLSGWSDARLAVGLTGAM